MSDDTGGRCEEIPQQGIGAWARETFGEEDWTQRARAIRFIEEALELVQALGLDLPVVLRVAARVYEGPPGTVAQELGGTVVSLCALAEQVGMSLEEAGTEEFQRVLSLPAAHFRERNRAKCEAGLR